MPSAFTHAFVGVSIGYAMKPAVPGRILPLGAVCSVLPDLDSIGFRFGVQYSDFLGHRGFTHSIFFALLLGCVGLLPIIKRPSMGRLWTWLYFSLAAASHGILDAMTNGGMGVALLSPFDNQRFFFPWRPIKVSPLSAGVFFSDRGVAILGNEFLWVWAPCLTVVLIVFLYRRHLKGAGSGGVVEEV